MAEEKDLLKAYFEMERESGITEYLLSRAAQKESGKEGLYIRGLKSAAFRTQIGNGRSVFRSKKQQPSSRGASLCNLREEASRCTLCALAASRRNVVFGAGNIDAQLMFIGEAPGYEEDMQGLPFVGEAGRLLTKIINAMGMKREGVYICNILKCRPPANRNPLPDEIASCLGYLYAQIDIIRPAVICGLGKFASQVLLKTSVPITHLRGRWHEFKGIKFMPTYHPAYLLRNPKDKKLVWEDMKKIVRELKGIKV